LLIKYIIKLFVRIKILKNFTIPLRQKLFLSFVFTSFAFSTAYAPYAPYALKYERVKYEVKAKEVKTKDYHLNKVPHGTIYDG
jgi:hypothetical protein